jgi:putative endonuclease
MTRGGTVYIMTNKNHTVLYTGVTSDLVSRVHQHISKFYNSSFTAKYNVNKLVYYCNYPTIEEAIAEEKRIKGGSRTKKLRLIESKNIMWEDLWIKEVSKW